MLCHRKSASSLSMETSICCKRAFPGKDARKYSFYGRKLIAEATFCCSSDRQSRSCGLLMKGPKAFHPFLGFVDSLTALGAPRSGFPQTPFRERRIRDKGKQFSYGIIIAIITQKRRSYFPGAFFCGSILIRSSGKKCIRFGMIFASWLSCVAALR